MYMQGGDNSRDFTISCLTLDLDRQGLPYKIVKLMHLIISISANYDNGFRVKRTHYFVYVLWWE